MKAKFALLLALFLTGCGPEKGQLEERDDQYFESERVGDPVYRRITVVLHPTLGELVHSYPSATKPKNLKGYSRWTTKTCVIHIVDPKTSYMPVTAGHELTHCLYGEFHPSQN